MRFTTLVAGACVLAVTAGAALSGSHENANPFARQIGARQAPMKIMAFNLGILGAMAKGEMEYDAAAASLAASNVLAAASVKQPGAWPEDSDNGFAEGTKALPAIWEDMAGFNAQQDELIAAATGLQPMAGADLDSLRAGLGAVGKACGTCHEKYRAE